jgi:hypothetical protein
MRQSKRCSINATQQTYFGPSAEFTANRLEPEIERVNAALVLVSQPIEEPKQLEGDRDLRLRVIYGQSTLTNQSTSHWV